MTLNSTSSIQPSLLENTTTYDALLQPNLNQEITGRRYIENWDKYDINRRGDIAEQYVLLQANLRGAEVFKNINCTGAGDFVLGLNNLNSLYPLDVKTGWWEENPYAGKPRWRAMNGYKAKKPVYCVVVLPKPEGLTARWLFRSRARDPICPEGLENFWN